MHDSARSHDSHDHDHDHDDHTDHDHSAHAHAQHGSSCSGHDHGDGHGHDGHHDHDHGLFGHHHHAPDTFGGIFAISMVLNSVYLVIEAIWGVLSHSLALLADAGHNLSDILALGAAWLAHSLTRRSPSARYTYGLRRSSILAALSNAVILLLVTGGIAWEAVLRLLHPTETISGRTVMIVAAIGIVVNGGTALLLMKGQKDDLNIRGAFLHMATDAIASLAVVIIGGLVLLTGLQWLDPAISLLISALIVLTTWSLLRGSLDMMLDAVPQGIDMDEIDGFFRGLPGVTDLHDLHVWAMSTTETALTAHLVRTTDDTDDGSNDRILDSANQMLRTRFGIVHTTIQIETVACHVNCIGNGHV